MLVFMLFCSTVGTYFPVWSYFFSAVYTVSDVVSSVVFCFFFDDTWEDSEVFLDFEIVFFKYRSAGTYQEIHKYSQRSKYHHYKNRKYLKNQVIGSIWDIFYHPDNNRNPYNKKVYNSKLENRLYSDAVPHKIHKRSIWEQFTHMFVVIVLF